MILIPFFVLTLLLVITEGVFSFIPKSHIAPTLSTKLWYSYYWSPVNKKGFRDEESDCYTNSKEKIFFAGDSFAAGHGIKNIKNRYSDIVKSKLESDEICISNIAKPGLNSIGQYELLKGLGIKPDILVYQYYVNDILDSAMELGSFYTPSSQSLFNKIIVNNSYILSYLKYATSTEKFEPNFQTYLDLLYQNEQVLNHHLHQLEQIFDLVEDKRIVCVLFPDLEDVGSSKPKLQSVISILKEREIEYIDLSAYISGMSLNDRIVNQNDPHPSEKLNQLVAKLIIEQL